jgi:hypothetical protein
VGGSRDTGLLTPEPEPVNAKVEGADHGDKPTPVTLNTLELDRRLNALNDETCASLIGCSLLHSHFRVATVDDQSSVPSSCGCLQQCASVVSL